MIGLANKLCDTIGFVDTSDSSNPVQLVLHCAFSFWIKFFDGSFAYISYIVLTKDCCSFYSSSQSAANFFFDWLFVLEHLFFNNLALGDGHIDIHHMDWKIWNLGLYHSLFLCSLHSFVLKHILHIIVLKTIYDLMSNVTTNMTGIPHMSQIWQEYLTCLCILICWVISLEIAGVGSSFHLYRSQHYDLFCDNLYNTFLLFLGLFEVFELILSY